VTGPDSVRPLLQMLDHVLREHEVAERGPTRVVPCLTDNIAIDIDVFIAAVHAAGGAVLNTTRQRARGEATPADRETYRGPVEGRTTSTVGAILETALTYRRVDGKKIGINLVKRDGDVDVAFVIHNGDPNAALPAADDPLLALTRALCSARLADQTLAVVIYDESEMDADQKTAAWNVSAHLEGLQLGPRTLLLLAASPDISFSRHVDATTGFRFARHEGVMVRRHPPVACDAMIADIVRGDPSFIGLFLGAGFSASSRLALGNQLRDDAIRALQLSPSDADSTALARDWYKHIESLEQLLESEVPLSLEARVAALTLERVLREEYRSFLPEPPPTLQKFSVACADALRYPGGAPESLARIIRSGRKLLICTVNFDELIETAAGASCRVFATDEQFGDACNHLKSYLSGRDIRVPVWKLHGTISDLNSCVASDAQTLVGVSGPKQRALETMLELTKNEAPSPWVYVGASMRDTDLNKFWSRADFAERVREYWAMPFVVAPVRAFVLANRAERWSQRDKLTYDQRQITETADTFLARLADKLELSKPKA